MIRKERDHYRWRRRYAWRPRKIGPYWIWLEWYAWRTIPHSEWASLYDLWFPRIEWWDEFVIKGRGYTGWRRTIIPGPMCPPMRDWFTPPRPTFRVIEGGAS